MLRPASERHSDHNALSHAAGKAMRILVQARARRANADALKNAQRLSLGRFAFDRPVIDQRFCDLKSGGENRVEARHPLLEIMEAIWLCLRFTLRLRDVEDLLAERGVAVSYETVRRWVNHFGPMIAADLRKRRPKPHPTWHLDEVNYPYAGELEIVSVPKGSTWRVALSDTSNVRAPPPPGSRGTPFGDKPNTLPSNRRRALEAAMRPRQLNAGRAERRQPIKRADA